MPENELMPNPDTHDLDTGDQKVDFAFWDVPGSKIRVIYSLALFHEIDFVVNEGYRKIPHGGIEVGGLLYGTVSGETVRLEAFRNIDCEHASGPSLNLSERDLNELENQITTPASDPELRNLQPVGWFLAHTRGPLDLTEAEFQQFERFFPDPIRVTVLVKPERFQPTRFGFLVRQRDGIMPREATSQAVILPLPGRAHKPGQLIASIPAPAPTSAIRKAPAPVRQPEPEEVDELPVPASPKPMPASRPAPEPVPLSIWKTPPDEEEIASEPPPEPLNDFRTPEERSARRRLARDRARVMEQSFPAAPVFRPTHLPSLPANTTLPQPGYLPPGYVPAAYFPQGLVPAGYIPVEQAPPRSSIINPRSLTALALAALLGCLVGYIGYLQLPSPVIALDVRPVNQTIVVSWPANETKNSIYAAIRFNDGAPVPLSAEEKATGQVSLAATTDFKVEVIARNWARDSRGIVRYMHSANGTGETVPLPVQ